MKVFVRNLAGGGEPTVVAFYPDDSDVKDDAHGADATVLTLPSGVLKRGNPDLGGLPTLLADWRQRAGAAPFEAEAKRRAAEVFAPGEELDVLYELVDILSKYGADASKWPADARQRKAEIDEKFGYLRLLRERVRGFASSQAADPTSDKNWPPRPAKRS